MVKRNSWTTIYDFVNITNNHMLGSCMFQARSQPLLDEVKHITPRKKRNAAFLFLNFRFSKKVKGFYLLWEVVLVLYDM